MSFFIIIIIIIKNEKKGNGLLSMSKKASFVEMTPFLIHNIDFIILDAIHNQIHVTNYTRGAKKRNYCKLSLQASDTCTNIPTMLTRVKIKPPDTILTQISHK